MGVRHSPRLRPDGANISRMFARVNARPAKLMRIYEGQCVTRVQARDGTQQ
jgi:hypothetical protein